MSLETLRILRRLFSSDGKNIIYKIQKRFSNFGQMSGFSVSGNEVDWGFSELEGGLTLF